MACSNQKALPMLGVISRNHLIAKKLNTEFAKLYAEMQKCFDGFTYVEASIATEWLMKLKKEDKTLRDLKLRNAFMRFFIERSEHKLFLRPPFRFLKFTVVTLNSLSQFLPSRLLAFEEDSEDSLELEKVQLPYSVVAMDEILRNCPDGGKFLDSVPVPSNGSFFIIIIQANNDEGTQPQVSSEEKQNNKQVYKKEDGPDCKKENDEENSQNCKKRQEDELCSVKRYGKKSRADCVKELKEVNNLRLGKKCGQHKEQINKQKYELKHVGNKNQKKIDSEVQTEEEDSPYFSCTDQMYLLCKRPVFL